MNNRQQCADKAFCFMRYLKMILNTVENYLWIKIIFENSTGRLVWGKCVHLNEIMITILCMLLYLMFASNDDPPGVIIK